MEQTNSWIPFQEIDFSNKEMNHFYVDTRDFYCISGKEGDKGKINWDKLMKYPERFFVNLEELQSFLVRIYNESGGEKEWRFLQFESPFNDSYWKFKYIRIYRVSLNIDLFVICDKDSFTLHNDILETKIKLEDWDI